MKVVVNTDDVEYLRIYGLSKEEVYLVERTTTSAAKLKGNPIRVPKHLLKPFEIIQKDVCNQILEEGDTVAFVQGKGLGVGRIVKINPSYIIIQRVDGRGVSKKPEQLIKYAIYREM